MIDHEIERTVAGLDEIDGITVKDDEIIETKQSAEEEIQKIKDEISSKELPIFGHQINMGDITMEEYNAIVQRMGNRFINSVTGDVLCSCGEFHKIKVNRNGKRIECPTFGFKVKGMSRPKLYERWIRKMIAFYEDIEFMVESIADSKENNNRS